MFLPSAAAVSPDRSSDCISNWIDGCSDRDAGVGREEDVAGFLERFFREFKMDPA